MASIPCAAYQVGHLHGTLRREHHSRMRAMSMSRHGIFEEKHSTQLPVLLMLTNSLSRLVHDVRVWSHSWINSTNTKSSARDMTIDSQAK
ncbi:hypothetical protein NP493_1197g00109 [Ridgeia piscesae]|uniref:Uncharacterized protein n=1 Tax=Ridgeia piscesae TaxID=27915 RepID=A0AAD9KCQ8_RIDPI|nr:hypothetical protein NP493_1197g00109 [Ridgeia piscesae]